MTIPPGLVFRYGCARVLPRATVAPGLAGGLAFAVVVHLLLDGVDLVWRDGPLAWVAAALICATFLIYLRFTPAAPADLLAPWQTWFLVGPAFLLVGMFAGSLTALIDWAGNPAMVVVEVGALLVGCAYLVQQSTLYQKVRENPARWTSIGFGLFLTVFTVIVLADPTNLVIAGPVALAAIGRLLAASARHDAPAGRPGGALIGGMLLFLITLFAYYSAYDLNLGFPNWLAPALVALTVGVVCTIANWRVPVALDNRLTWTVKPFLAGLLALPLVLLSSWHPTPAQSPKTGDTFKLITYNVRMGYGLDGRLSLDQIGSWAAAQRPDVVLLSEVDRGWMLNGGHDDLARIAKGLGMRAYFAPAADPLWGEALLTNLPVKQLASHRLGRHGHPTGAQAQAIVLEIGGKEVGIVNTHLQAPPAQAA